MRRTHIPCTKYLYPLQHDFNRANFSCLAGFRNTLVAGWMRDVTAQELPSTEGYSFTEFLAKPTDVRAWNIQVNTEPN